MSRGRPGERGSVLLAVVLALSVVGAVAYLMNREGALDVSLAGRAGEAEAARAVAEAGLAHARWLASQSACSGYDLPATAFGQHLYSASFAPTSGSPVAITATGTLAGGARHELVSTAVPVYEPSTTVSLQLGTDPGGDVHVDAFYPTLNYGGVGYLNVSPNPSWRERALLQFDLSSLPATMTVLSARLTLHQQSVASAGADARVSVHRVTRSWVEGTRLGGGAADGATWNDHDGAAPWSAPGADFDPREVASAPIQPASGVWVGFEIAPLVNEWITGARPNHGVLLLGQGALNQVSFDSKESSSSLQRPRLDLVYACECGGGTSQTLPLQPGASGEDTYIDSKFNLENHGAEPMLRLKNKSTGIMRGLLRFDLSMVPNQALIQSATVTLHLESVGSGNSGPVDLHRVTTPWVEGTGGVVASCWDGASWLEHDGACGAWSIPGGDFVGTESATATVDALLPGPVIWDVKDLVQDWVSGAQPNHGLLLDAGLGLNNVDFTSGDGAIAADHPRLDLQWSCPCNVVCTVIPNVYRDEFTQNDCTAADYTGSDGDLDWSGQSWVEVGESNGSCNGGVRLASDLGDNSVRFQDESGLERAVDLSGFTTAFVSFGYRRSDWEGGELLHVETWDESTSAWVEVGTIDAPGSVTDADYLTASFEITPYASAASAIRLRTTGQGGSGAGADLIYLDDVQIDETGSSGGGPGGGADHSVTLAATADATLAEGLGDQGLLDELIVGRDNAGPHRHSVLRFDLSSIPAGAPVVAATLRVNVKFLRGNDLFNVGAHRVDQTWAEPTADWIEALGGVPWTAGPGGTYDPTPVDSLPADHTGWYEWDVAPLVQEWVDGISPNHGVALVHTAVPKRNRVEIYSREASSPTKLPELVVEYDDP